MSEQERHALRELVRAVESVADDQRLAPLQWKKLAQAMNRAHKVLGWLPGVRWSPDEP